MELRRIFLVQGERERTLDIRKCLALGFRVDQEDNFCRPEPTTDTEDKGSHVTITIMWSTFPQKHYPRTPLTYFQKA